jgi:hypothetical protein
MRELFIYYRSRAECSVEVAERVREFQERLVRRHPHLVARLLRRPELRDGHVTWMETYSIPTMHNRAGVSAELQSEIEAQAHTLGSSIVGERHTEVFDYVPGSTGH